MEYLIYIQSYMTISLLYDQENATKYLHFFQIGTINFRALLQFSFFIVHYFIYFIQISKRLYPFEDLNFSFLKIFTLRIPTQVIIVVLLLYNSHKTRFLKHFYRHPFLGISSCIFHRNFLWVIISTKLTIILLFLLKLSFIHVLHAISPPIIFLSDFLFFYFLISF